MFSNFESFKFRVTGAQCHIAEQAIKKVIKVLESDVIKTMFRTFIHEFPDTLTHTQKKFPV